MSLLVDTSVWSLALRRDLEATEPEVQELKEALFRAEVVVTTGLVLQEFLQGFSGAKAQEQIVERFAALPLLRPDRDDHIASCLADQGASKAVTFSVRRLVTNPGRSAPARCICSTARSS
jgi:predicted nucleic acid-binding protein